VLLLVGLPLIFFREALPSWLEASAETAVGVIILALSARVLVKWMRGDLRSSQHGHGEAAPVGRRATSTSSSWAGPPMDD